MIRMRRLEDLDPVADKASYKNIYNALNIAGLTNKTSLGQQRWLISLHQSGDPHLLLKQGLKKHQHFQTIECASKGWLCFWHKCWNIHDFWLLTIKKKQKKRHLPFQPPPDWLPWQCRLTVLAIPSSRSHTPSHAQDLHTVSALYDYYSISEENCLMCNIPNDSSYEVCIWQCNSILPWVAM